LEKKSSSIRVIGGSITIKKNFDSLAEMTEKKKKGQKHFYVYYSTVTILDQYKKGFKKFRSRW